MNVQMMTLLLMLLFLQWGSGTFTPNNLEALKLAVHSWKRDRSQALKQYGPIADWCTSHVTSMEELFESDEDFNDDISRWDTSQVTSMDYMFYGAVTFNQDIGKWDTSKVMGIRSMFKVCVTP